MSNNTLKERLKALGMTQNSLAKALGINPVSVSRWESPPRYAVAFVEALEDKAQLRERVLEAVK